MEKEDLEFTLGWVGSKCLQYKHFEMPAGLLDMFAGLSTGGGLNWGERCEHLCS